MAMKKTLCLADGTFYDVIKVDLQADQVRQKDNVRRGMDMKMRTLFIILWTCAIMVRGSAAMASGPTIQAAITEWPPYLMYEGTGVKGMIIDILNEVSARTGYRIIYNQLPTKRSQVYFTEGKITLEPGSNPAWRKQFSKISCYSIPYYQVQTVILGKKGRLKKKANGPEDFHGMILGGQLGYSGYGDGFDKAFTDGTITREDVPSGAKGSILKLAANRVDGILIDRLAAWHTIKTLGLNPNDYEELYLFKVDEHLFLRFHNSQKALLPRVNSALKAMKDEGVIDKIAAKYSK
jgi:ABC-type amino acid transport substrate-binding protein